jgi:hypothetical protein
LNKDDFILDFGETSRCPVYYSWQAANRLKKKYPKIPLEILEDCCYNFRKDKYKNLEYWATLAWNSIYNSDYNVDFKLDL